MVAVLLDGGGRRGGAGRRFGALEVVVDVGLDVQRAHGEGIGLASLLERRRRDRKSWRRRGLRDLNLTEMRMGPLERERERERESMPRKEKRPEKLVPYTHTYTQAKTIRKENETPPQKRSRKAVRERNKTKERRAERVGCYLVGVVAEQLLRGRQSGVEGDLLDPLVEVV